MTRREYEKFSRSLNWVPRSINGFAVWVATANNPEGFPTVFIEVTCDDDAQQLHFLDSLALRPAEAKATEAIDPIRPNGGSSKPRGLPHVSLRELETDRLPRDSHSGQISCDWLDRQAETYRRR